MSGNSILISSLIIICLGCHPERECFICPIPVPYECHEPDLGNDTLLITGFEAGENPTEWMGHLSKWDDTLSSIVVHWQYDSIGGGAWGSKFYALLEILGNDATSVADWSGGGLTLTLTDCYLGNDLSNYDSLQFEIKVFGNHNLAETKIKLEDTINDSIPERLISKYGVFPSTNWETISIPLNEFNLIKTSDTLLHDWVALDPHKIIRIVTTTVNRQPSSPAMDGKFGIDNMRFVKN